MFDALLDIAADPMGLEYGAALYESYAADHEPNHRYASAAMRLAEEIEYAYYDRLSA